VKNETIKTPEKSLLKLSVAAFVLATFCTATQAQIVSDASYTNLGGGVTLDSVFISNTTNQQDPVEIYLVLTGIQGGSTPTNHQSWVTIPSPSFGTSNGAAVTVLAAYAALAGTVTQKYATYVASANGVLVDFATGNPARPLVVGSVYNAVTQIAISKAVEVSSPSFFQNSGFAGFQTLLAQFSFASPFASAPGPACSGIATQLDVDDNGNLLVHVFQSNGQPFIGVTVTLFVSSSGGTPVQFQAISDSNGLAQFNGPSNTVTLTSETSITAIELQSSITGAPSVCSIQLQASSCSTTTDLGAARESGNAVKLPARSKKEADPISEPGTGFRKARQEPSDRTSFVSEDAKLGRANTE
jgi:hypothetical protein